MPQVPCAAPQPAQPWAVPAADKAAATMQAQVRVLRHMQLQPCRFQAPRVLRHMQQQPCKAQVQPCTPRPAVPQAAAAAAAAMQVPGTPCTVPHTAAVAMHTPCAVPHTTAMQAPNTPSCAVPQAAIAAMQVPRPTMQAPGTPCAVSAAAMQVPGAPCAVPHAAGPRYPVCCATGSNCSHASFKSNHAGAAGPRYPVAAAVPKVISHGALPAHTPALPNAASAAPAPLPADAGASPEGESGSDAAALARLSPLQPDAALPVPEAGAIVAQAAAPDCADPLPADLPTSASLAHPHPPAAELPTSSPAHPPAAELPTSSPARPLAAALPTAAAPALPPVPAPVPTHLATAPVACPPRPVESLPGPSSGPQVEMTRANSSSHPGAWKRCERFLVRNPHCKNLCAAWGGGWWLRTCHVRQICGERRERPRAGVLHEAQEEQGGGGK